MVNAPKVVISVRVAIEAEVPRNCSIRVMSAVRRETASPERIFE